MKKFKIFCLVMLGLALLVACEKQNDELQLNEEMLLVQDDVAGLSAKENKMHTKPFKAKFFTQRKFDKIIGSCDEEPYVQYNLQRGDGKGTHLGKFTVELFFCGNGFEYKNGEGAFVAANGDSLYFKIPSPDMLGHVVLIEDPFYEAQFQDPFVFVGGTGRFEGASGGGYTDSFVDLFDDEGNFIPEHKTDHKWTGTLTMKKKIKDKVKD